MNSRVAPPSYDTSYAAHVGWAGTIADQPSYQSLWAPQRLQVIQAKITDLLEGVDPLGRPIQVPLAMIGSVMSEVFKSNRPQVGSIYSRYIQTEPEEGRDDVRDIVDRTINIIVSQIKNETLNNLHNQSLTIWSSLYGDFNNQGLRAHAPIKVRKAYGQRMAFQMNY